MEQNKHNQTEIKEEQSNPDQTEIKEEQNKPNQTEIEEKLNISNQTNNKEKQEDNNDDVKIELNNKQQNIDGLSDHSLNSDELPKYIYIDLKEEIDKKNQQILLKVINEIAKTRNLSFPNLFNAVKKDNLFKFVNIFFENDHDFIQLMNSSKEIDDIITFLSTKEPIFKVLLFNFKESKYVYSSAMSFYKNFLNCFFIKKTKQELYERFISIVFDVDLKDKKHSIFPKVLNDSTCKHKHRDILFSWNAYMVLLNFVNKRKRNFRVNQNDINMKNIPLLFDQEYLNICREKEQDALYYQLQFIFNAIDNQKYVYYFHECFLKAVQKIKQVKVPNYKKLANSIRAKNISLILQIKSYKKFHIKEGNIEKINLQEYNSLKKDIIQLPNNFASRQLNKENPKEKQELQKKNHTSLSIQNPESFWNPIENYYSNDSIFSRLNKKLDKLREKRWVDNILHYNNYIERNSISDEDGPLFNCISVRKVKPKLYKLFYYNEKTQKWEMNSDDVSDIFKTKNSDLNKPKNVLVLCFNSSESELITFNSTFITTLYPDLDDENIYVYGLYDKPISLLQYHINISIENSHITPLFLMLHVPKSKQKMDNIKSILLKIYNFLSFICDIEIVILNKELYIEQIDLIKSVKNIQRSYNETLDTIMEEKSNIKQKSNEELSQNEDDLDSDYYSDIEYSDEEQNTNENCYNSDMKDLNYIIMNTDLQIKKTNYIILVNDDKIEGDITQVNNNDLFDYIKEQINEKLLSINYININNHDTYRLFFDCLKKFTSNVQFEYENILNNFKLFQLTGICNKYINLKCKEFFRSALTKEINDRFIQFKESSCNDLSDFDILSQINNEITNVYPSIDSDFKANCNLILNKITQEIIHDKSKIITSELDISSTNHIDYLKKIINSKHYWSINQKENIKNKHANFIKNEFYSILKAFYQRNDWIYIFECYNRILQSKIEKYIQEIDQIFIDFEKQYKSSEDQIVNLKDEMNDGTNYSIRETERVKEIKVIVEAGHLQDAIEQDF